MTVMEKHLSLQYVWSDFKRLKRCRNVSCTAHVGQFFHTFLCKCRLRSAWCAVKTSSVIKWKTFLAVFVLLHIYTVMSPPSLYMHTGIFIPSLKISSSVCSVGFSLHLHGCTLLIAISRHILLLRCYEEYNIRLEDWIFIGWTSCTFIIFYYYSTTLNVFKLKCCWRSWKR